MLQSRINELENELKGGHTVPVAKDKIIAGTMFGPYHYFVLQNNYLMNNTQASLHLADKDNFKYLSRSKLLLEVKLFNGNVKDKKYTSFIRLKMKSRGMLIRLLYDIGNNKEKWYAEDSDRFYISSGWEDIVIFASVIRLRVF